MGQLNKKKGLKNMENEKESLEIIQKSSIGSETTQIGVQNNYNGLSISSVIETAFSIFKEYYPQLKNEALNEVRKLVDAKLEAVGEENIIMPKPKNVIPVLQNASITEESILRELYANLLSSSMIKGLESRVHPAFVHIINQMSAQDAMLLNSIVEINNSIPVAHVKFTFDTQYLTEVLPHYYSPYFTYSEDKNQISLSIENLSRLQLINLFEGNVISYYYDRIKTDPFIQKRYEYAKLNNPTRILNIGLDEYVIQLNDLGKNFVEICLSP